MTLEHLLCSYILSCAAFRILGPVICRRLVFFLETIEVVFQKVLLIKLSACLFIRARSSFIIVNDITLLAAYFPSMSLIHNLCVCISFEQPIVLVVACRVNRLIVGHYKCFVKKFWCVFEVPCSLQILLPRKLSVL